jgi:hypothetical protein
MTFCATTLLSLRLHPECTVLTCWQLLDGAGAGMHSARWRPLKHALIHDGGSDCSDVLPYSKPWLALAEAHLLYSQRICMPGCRQAALGVAEAMHTQVGDAP